VGSFGDAAKNALAKIADKLIDRGLDGIFNSLFGDGQSGGGGMLSQLLNGGNSGSVPRSNPLPIPAGPSWASCLVAAASPSGRCRCRRPSSM
jgi:hypothetical protein